MKAGNFVNGESDCSTHDKGVSGSRTDVGKLDIELLPVVLDPSTCDETGVDTVEANNVGGGEDTVEDEANHSSDAVFSENIKGIIDLDPEFDCGIVSVVTVPIK